jgi:ketosteroid isomerase-like protein
MGTARDTVNHFYTLSNQQAAGLPAMRALITDDITLEGPLNHTSGADAYVAVLEQLLPAHVDYRIHTQFEADDQVCSIYDLLLKAPTGQTIAIPMVDWITLRDGLIAAQKLYYDPRELMQAFGM